MSSTKSIKHLLIIIAFSRMFAGPLLLFWAGEARTLLWWLSTILSAGNLVFHRFPRAASMLAFQLRDLEMAIGLRYCSQSCRQNLQSAMFLAQRAKLRLTFYIVMCIKFCRGKRQFQALRDSHNVHGDIGIASANGAFGRILSRCAR